MTKEPPRPSIITKVRGFRRSKGRLKPFKGYFLEPSPKSFSVLSAHLAAGAARAAIKEEKKASEE